MTMGFHLRIDNDIVARVLLHQVVKSVVGAIGEDCSDVRNGGAEVGSGTDFLGAKEVLSVDADHADDGGFASHLL